MLASEANLMVEIHELLKIINTDKRKKKRAKDGNIVKVTNGPISFMN